MTWFDWANERLGKWKAEASSPQICGGNFTPRAMQVMSLAGQEAQRLNHNFIGTEHVLLGLLRLDQGVAVNVLHRLGITYETAQTQIEELIGRGPDDNKPEFTPYTPRTKKVVVLARKSATALHHTYVGTEHLLLGLLEEGEGVAARVLRDFKVDLKQLHKAIMKELVPEFSISKPAAEEQTNSQTMHDELFLQQFESKTWPKADWHHRQHIKVAYLYLRRYSLEVASVKISEGIKAYNAAHQVEESLTSGYHETMTQAWLRLVYFVLCEYGPAGTADEFFEQHPELSQVKTLRLFYSRERFLTEEAKANFVEPDITPLPRSRKDPPATLSH